MVSSDLSVTLNLTNYCMYSIYILPSLPRIVNTWDSGHFFFNTSVQSNLAQLTKSRLSRDFFYLGVHPIPSVPRIEAALRSRYEVSRDDLSLYIQYTYKYLSLYIQPLIPRIIITSYTKHFLLYVVAK